MSTTPTDDMILPPNHHAHHPGFGGFAGLLAAITFTIRRGADADLAVELTGTGHGDEVVDIGCGPGVAARRAAARGASSVVGIDPAAVMLRVARAVPTLSTVHRRGAAVVRYQEGAAEAPPLADGAVTVAWSLATVHHWRDLDAGLAEARRVLRPAGRFLVIERRVAPGGDRPRQPRLDRRAGPRVRRALPRQRLHRHLGRSPPPRPPPPGPVRRRSNPLTFPTAAWACPPVKTFRRGMSTDGHHLTPSSDHS